MWLIDRVVDPRAIDAELDARIRGSVAHQALYRFYSGLPKRFGADQVDAERLDETIEFMRECLGAAIEGQVRLDLSELDRLELEGTLGRDLERFVRQEVGDRARRSSRAASRSRSERRARRSSCSAASTWAASPSPGRSTGSTSTR